jgi:predicted dehydrogenase
VTPDVVIAALESGRHVFCEKPPGRGVADIERIREVHARRPGLVLKFGFNHRYHAGVQEAHRIVRSGRLGHVMWMRGVYGKSGGAGFESQWRSSRASAGGGILLDQGIHMLDLFRHFAGDFNEVRSMVGNAFWNVDVEDNAFALLRTGAGVVAMLHSSSTQWRHRFSLEVYLTGGYVSVNGILSSTRTYGDETVTVARRDFSRDEGRPVEETIYFDEDPSWELEVRDFVRNVRLGRPVEHGTSEDALRAMELVESIYAADPSRDDARSK